MAFYIPRSLLHFCIIFTTGVIVYSNTLYVPFYFDDIPNINENYTLRDMENFWPPSGLRWFGFLTFALNYHFGGLNTLGYHIVNLVIHILNATLVYWLVMLTLRIQDAGYTIQDTGNTPLCPPLIRGELKGGNMHHASCIMHRNSIALFSALIFVSHPIQTQAVTYIVQRFTSLATFFYLLSLVMYIKFRMRPSAISHQPSAVNGLKSRIFKLKAKSYMLYAASFLSAILAVKTKEISFTLPFVIILYEFSFFVKKINSNKLFYLLPFIVVIFFIPLSIIGIDKPLGDIIGELRERTAETTDIERWSYLLTQFRVIVTYIKLFFLPVNQNLLYDYPIYRSFFDPNVYLSFMFLLGLFGLGIYLFYRSWVFNRSLLFTVHGSQSSNFQLVSFGIFWFFITLSVESSIIPIRDVIFEHRMYLPSIGVIIAFSSAIFYVLNFVVYGSQFTVHGSRFLLIAVIIALSIATYTRNNVWRDRITLWEDVVKKSPYNHKAHNNLGNVYLKKGRMDEAIQEYLTVLRLNFNTVEGHYNLGFAYASKGRFNEAIHEYKTALRLDPDHAEVHNNLGLAYYNQGRLNDAVREFIAAIGSKPAYPEAHNNLGSIYMTLGLIDDAITHYKAVLRLNPDLAGTHNNLGFAYKQKGLINEAVQEFLSACRLQPDACQNLELFQKKGM